MMDVNEYMSMKNADTRRSKIEEVIQNGLHGPEGLQNILTKRQLEILEMVLKGRSNKMISQELGLVERTVEYHRNRIMGKLGVHNSVTLCKLVIAMGLDF